MRCNCTELKQGFIHDFWARNSGQTTGTQLSANQAPKWNHTAGTFAPQPMLGWHLKVPATHLDKPLTGSQRWKYCFVNKSIFLNNCSGSRIIIYSMLCNYIIVIIIYELNKVNKTRML